MLRVLALLAATAAIAGASPARTVHGTVTARDSGQPIAGARLDADDGSAATTGLDGTYVLGLGPGAHSVAVSATGYVAETLALTGDLPGDVLDATLAPAPDEVIEVRGKAPEQTRPQSYHLSADEVRLLPGAGNDILRAVQILPGVARIPYSFGGLVLRGTAPSDTQVFLDGIEVPIAFHFGGITSFYPASMLADLTVTSGGFDAEYGRAEGGIVTLTTREPRTDRWRVGGSLGLLDSAVEAEGPLGSGGVLIGVRRSYFDTIVGPFVGSDLPLPSYWDAQIRASFGDPARHGRISPTVFLSIDQVANHTTGAVGDTEHVSLDSMFVRVAAPYLRQWGPLALRLVPWLGLNQLSYEDIHDGMRESYERPVYPGGLRADLTRDFAWGDVRGGLDSEGGYLTHAQVGFTGGGVGPAGSDSDTTLSWVDVALWGEARVVLGGGRLAVKPGVRGEYYGLTDEWVLDPRLALHEQLTPHLELREALGRFHQPPAPGDLDPKNGNANLKSSYYDQASLGLDAELSPSTSASVTGFYEYGWDQGVRFPDPRHPESFEPDLGGLGPTFDLLLERQLGFTYYRLNQGRARTAGLEVLVKHHVGRWFWMLGYTLSKAERRDDPVTSWRRFELDERHDLNIAGSVALHAWRLGARIQLVTGAPYSPTVCMGASCTQYAWAGTLPTFFQLDLRADRRWHRCWGDVDLYFDIQNATDYGNVEGREFDDAIRADRDIPGLPIMPFVGVELVPR